jgi:hypothetical protein
MRGWVRGNVIQCHLQTCLSGSAGDRRWCCVLHVLPCWASANTLWLAPVACRHQLVLFLIRQQISSSTSDTSCTS